MDVINKYQIFVFINIYIFAQVKASSKVLYFRRFEKHYNAYYISNISTDISADHYAFNITIHQLRDATVDFWMRIDVAIKDPLQQNYRSILPFNANICNLLHSGSKRYSLGQRWLVNVLKHSNMPQKCPWKADIYYWRNFRMAKENIPDFILNGCYRVNTLFYFKELNNALFSNFTIFVDVKTV